MGCGSSDDEYYPEVKEEEEYPTFFQEPNINSRIIASQTDAFGLTGNQNAPIPGNLATFADECCKEFGLADALKEDVLRTAKLPPHLLLLRLHARTVAFGEHVQTTQVNSFLTSREFKETITRRLQAGLLEPHISHYVNGTTAQFVRHIIENPASYEIPMAVQAQFMHSKQFSSAVGKVLSTFRGELQRKLRRSILDKENIATLASRLAIHGIQMSKEHLLRIAFLRMGYMGFTSKPRIRLSRSNNDKAMNNKAESQFWSFIDSKLEKLHQISPKDRLGSLERNLTEDKRIFPGPRATSFAIPSANIPEGQPNVTHAISTRAVCQSATPLVDTWSVDRDVASSRQPSADPSSLICEPEFEQDGGGEAPEPGSALDYAQATSVYMPIDSRYGHGQVSYPQSSLPAGTPTRRKITLARRGASHGMGLRSNAIRHNPLGTPSRLSAPSPILMGSPHRPENTQYCCERKEQI